MSNFTKRWCINCEEWVAVEQPIEGHSVVQFVPDMGEIEVFFCEGPFAFTCPEEYDKDFDLNISEPDDSELIIMNINAQRLMGDFE